MVHFSEGWLHDVSDIGTHALQFFFFTVWNELSTMYRSKMSKISFSSKMSKIY